MSLPRDLDIVELWSGTATICRAGEHKGHRVHPFDKIRSEEEDLTSLRLAFPKKHAANALQCVARCQEVASKLCFSFRQAPTVFAWR